MRAYAGDHAQDDILIEGVRVAGVALWICAHKVKMVNLEGCLITYQQKYADVFRLSLHQSL